MMKQISNGFESYYYLTEDAKVYNSKTNTYLTLSKRNSNNYNYNYYSLIKINGNRGTISQKKLYELVYDEHFCIDEIEDIEGEIWKPIQDTNNSYYVSNLGRVKSYKQYKAKLLSIRIHHNGYKIVDIMLSNGKKTTKFVHRLVANEFLLPPKSIEHQVHHINGNQLDNRVDNLVWLSPVEHARIHSGNQSKEENAR